VTEPDAASIWQGRRVRLRAIEPDDWAAFQAWNADYELARRLYHIPFPQSAAALRRWTEREANRAPKNDAFRWAIVDAAGSVVGAIYTHSCGRRTGAFG